jgi:hypothetical protein
MEAAMAVLTGGEGAVLTKTVHGLEIRQDDKQHGVIEGS